MTCLLVRHYLTFLADDDFLEAWEQIHRTLLFDSTWAMSSHWIQAQLKPLPSAWSYGDVSCMFHPFFCRYSFLTTAF